MRELHTIKSPLDRRKVERSANDGDGAKRIEEGGERKSEKTRKLIQTNEGDSEKNPGKQNLTNAKMKTI